MQRLLWILFLGITLSALSGCGDDEKQCTDDEGCPLGQRCVFGKCEQRTPSLDGDSITGVDGDLGEIVGPCNGVAPVSGEELRINEIHAAPQNGVDDTNCDTIADSGQDEFIEVVNNSTNVLSLDGVQLLFNGEHRMTLFGCLDPGRGMVIYSGGTAMCDGLGGTRTAVSSAGGGKTLRLTNSGGTVGLSTSTGDTLDSVPYPSLDSKHASWTRSPDFTGDFVHHDGVASTRFSAGKCSGGAELIKGCTTQVNGDDTDISDVPTDTTGIDTVGMDTTPGDTNPADVPPACNAPAVGDLVLNEVLYDPASAVGTAQTGGDANCDGSRSATQDEFVEFVNVASTAVNLKGVTVEVGGTAKYTFANDQCLDPRQAVVIFGGGNPTCPEFAGGIVLTDSLSLTNGGSTVRLLNAVGGTPFTRGTITWAAASAAAGQSLQRNPDLTGDATAAFSTMTGAAGRLQSPGTCVSGQPFSTGCTAACTDDAACTGHANGDSFCNGDVATSCATGADGCLDATTQTCSAGMCSAATGTAICQ